MIEFEIALNIREREKLWIKWDFAIILFFLWERDTVRVWVSGKLAFRFIWIA